MAPSSSPTTLETLDFCDSLGVAVFPQRRGLKGSFVEGWPDLPVEAALALTREEASLGPINLAGRTGGGCAVLDYDGKDVDPHTAVADVLPRLGDAVIGVVETGALRPETGRVGRGLHVWVAVAESVGNGFCTAIGGEVFSGPHLAMLPPSIHPEGDHYEWVLEPRQPSGKVDLRDLGFVPDEPTFHSGLPRSPDPAEPHVQTEFRALMQEARVVPRRKNQELHRCPWHDDKVPSLSINWAAALFHCFSESCLVGGGVGALRRLLGKHTPAYRQGRGSLSDGNLGCVEEEVERLTKALTALGQEDKAQKVRDCKKVFAVGRCTGCAASPAYPLTCGHRLCPRCMPGRLAADWKDHQGSIPDRLTLLKLVPRDFWGSDRGALQKVRNRFREWGARAGVAGGLYGIRLDLKLGAVVLLALPSGLPLPSSSLAFEVRLLAEDQSPDDFLRWLQHEYAEEARAWETDEDLALLLEQTRRRRRFQGFGGAYASAKSSQGADDVEPAAQPLHTVSGGAHSGGGKKDVRLCHSCGGRVEMYDFTVRLEEVELKDGQLQWRGPPGKRAAA